MFFLIWKVKKKKLQVRYEIIFRYLIFLIVLFLLIYLFPRTVYAFPGEELNLKTTDYFTKEDIKKAETYRVPKYWMWAGKNLLLIIFLSLFVFTPLGKGFANYCENLAGAKKWLIPAFYGAGLMTLWAIISFPINYYRSFYYEHSFSFSNQPPSMTGSSSFYWLSL